MKRPIEDETRQISAKHPQLITVGTVLQYSKTFNVLELTLPSFLDSRPEDRSQKVLRRERHELPKLRSRRMQELKKPIHDLSKAFVKFKEQETKQGEDHLVEPSGLLESRLAHYHLRR